MLRSNLSTRPFYNERAVQMLLLLAALLVLALTAYNAVRILSLSRHNTDLTAGIDRNRAEAQRLTADARRVRAGIDQNRLKAIADAASTANVLIDQRTFSWTEFFNHIEATLPPDVMLTSVQPSFARNSTSIQMAVLGRGTEHIDEFMERLEATGAFDAVLPVQEDRTEEGLHRVLLRSVYLAAPQAVTDDEDAIEQEQPTAGVPAAPDAAAPPAAAAAPERGGGAS